VSEYRWKNQYGERAVHEGSMVVFEIFEDGHGQSITGPAVGHEILRLRDALVAERERCAAICDAEAESLRKDEAYMRKNGPESLAPLAEAQCRLARRMAERIRQG
jgi:hypothetical protein